MNSCIYDKMTLRPHEWRTIKLDNFNVFERDSSLLESYTGQIRISLGKNLLEESVDGGKPAVKQAVFYLDNLIVRKK